MQYNPLPWLEPAEPPSTEELRSDASMFRPEVPEYIELEEQRLKADIQRTYSRLVVVQSVKFFISQNLMTPLMVEVLIEISHASKHFDDGILRKDLRRKFDTLSFYVWSQVLAQLKQRGLIEEFGSAKKQRVKATPVGTGVALLFSSEEDLGK